MARLKTKEDPDLGVDHELITNIKEGIFYDVPFEVYKRIDAINQSKLKAICRSPYHFRHSVIKEETDAMKFGSLIHAAQLEQRELSHRYIVMPDMTKGIVRTEGRDKGKPYDNPKATKIYKNRVADFAKRHPRKVIVDQEMLDKLHAVNASVDRHDDYRQAKSEGRSEVTVVWIDTQWNIWCKARIDLLCESGFVDIKTISNLTRTQNAVEDLQYHIQLAFYCRGLYERTGDRFEPWMLFVETDHPHDSAFAPFLPEDLAKGKQELADILKLYSECRESNHWPGLSFKHFRLPPYHKHPLAAVRGY